MLSLLAAHWLKLLSPLLGCASKLWAWFRFRQQLNRRCLGDVVAFHLLRLCKKTDPPTLKITNILRTSLTDLYPRNPWAAGMVVSFCGRNNDPFLDVGNPVRQAVLQSPMVHAISSRYAHDAMIEASDTGPTKDVELVFAMCWLEGGKENHFRVLVVTLQDLLLMRKLETNVLSGTILLATEDIDFLVSGLQKMSDRYLDELSRYGRPQTLGRVTVVVMDHYELAKLSCNTRLISND